MSDSSDNEFDAEAAAASEDERRQGGGAAGEGVSGSGEERNDTNSKRKKKKISQKRIQRVKEAYARKGVIYVSRIPPHMKPAKLRQLLEQYGEIGRLWCTPEDMDVRKKRKKAGGNTGKNFTEGWVEFEDKAVAKQVANMLNGQPIGGKKRSAYHFDLWCMKYLPKFKWDYLTEEIRYNNAIRQQKLLAEQAAAKKERDFYLTQVDRSKKMEAIAERRQKKGLAPDGTAAPGEAGGGDDAAAAEPSRKKIRTIKQRKAKADPVTDQSVSVGEDILSLIAGKKK